MSNVSDTGGRVLGFQIQFPVVVSDWPVLDQREQFQCLLSVSNVAHHCRNVYLLGEISRLLRLMLPFHGLSDTFVHCAQTAENIHIISFAYDLR